MERGPPGPQTPKGALHIHKSPRSAIGGPNGLPREAGASRSGSLSRSRGEG